MAKIINDSNSNFEKKDCKVLEYSWSSIPNLQELINMKNMKFNIRILEPRNCSYPYHFHRNAEEMFIILEGEASLRTPEGIERVKVGDVIYFEMGPSGAHQLRNESSNVCKYVDIRTNLGMDVCEYPDSGKVNILPAFEIYEADTKVDYFYKEEKINDVWFRNEE